jgi:multiple sugar transport system substrate-binding protein
VGCSKSGTGESPDPRGAITNDTKPVDIVIYSTSSDPVESFNYRYGDPLRKKFPNYNIKYIQSQKGTTLPEMLASRTSFDIFYHTIGNFESWMLPNGLEYDMSELVKKHGIDLNRVEPTIIDAVKQASGGKLYGLPVSTSNMVMYYNKALFDKFGVAYPRDGMTWDEIVDISKKMTRNEDGIQYFGFTQSLGHTQKLNQLSVPAVDLKTESPTINQDERWKRLYKLFLSDMISEPGYQTNMQQSGKAPDLITFAKDYRVAMFPYLSSLYYAWPEEMKAFDWDMVSLPTFKDLPNVGSQSYPLYFGVTKLSKQPDAAMELIKYMLSDEYQLELAKKGIMPVLKNQTIQESLGSESPFKAKNLKAIYLNKFAPIPPKPLYDAQVLEVFMNHGIQYQLGKVDLNTALRNAEEEAKKKIAEFKSK